MTAEARTYRLEGLCCADCAAEIEREVCGLDGVSGANVDFAAGVLTLELSGEEPAEDVAVKAAGIARRYDPDIVLAELGAAGSGSRVLFLSGLDCAACARRVEAAVGAIDGVRSASLDFVSQKLTVRAADRKDLPEILRKAAVTIHELEPEVRISYTETRTGETAAERRKRRFRQGALAAAGVLFAAGVIGRPPYPAAPILFLAACLLAGGEVVWKMVRNIAKGRVFEENFLMTVAVAGAFAIGEYAEGAAVMLFYRVGEWFQERAVDHSRRSISALMDIRPDRANLISDGEIREVPPEEVAVGDRIAVRPGERVPLDGRVVAGSSALDTSALTGESRPRRVEPGAGVLSGSINRGGVLTVEVTKGCGESAASKILDLVQNAGSRKAPTEAFLTKFARYYTPAVVFAAAALAAIPPFVVPDIPFSVWLGRALTFLVVSCPCAMVISIPLSFFGGIGSASRRGILIKGSNFLEALDRVDTVAFDKTGTLTKGNFRVTEIEAANGFSREQVLAYAAHAEAHSSHPIAVSIREAYGREPDAGRVSEYEEIAGEGVRARVDGREVLAGSAKLVGFEAAGGSAAGGSEAGTAVFLAVNGRRAGRIVISDEIRPDSARAVRGLKAEGVRRAVMLTGDGRTAAEAVGAEVGLDAVYAELLPQQKVERMERMAAEIPRGRKTVFVGDGINDAPVLARADVGVAMGGLGSDAAIEAADVVLMTDEPEKLVTAVRVAKKTRTIVRQNVAFALGVKFAILILAAFGIATMWAAVFGDVGVAVLAVLNSVRAMSLKEA